MTDYEKLVEQLRWNATEYQGCIFEDEDRQMCADAADAIEALQAQLPKRGEWINSKERMRPDMCSVCGCVYEADRFLGNIAWNYCPRCGAKMEVQE